LSTPIEAGEGDHPLQGVPELAVRRQLRPDGLQDSLRVLEAEDVEGLPEQAELATLQQQREVVGRQAGDLLRQLQVGLADERADSVVHQARLDRILLVDQHPDRGLLGIERRERLDVVDEVRRQDERRQGVAGGDHVPRLLLIRHVDALDPRAELATRPGDVELLPRDHER
jgi:hypothetical protein